ncbi:hypothetical protein F0170_03995 [Pseudomonas sp. MAFF 730085]|uniref:Uncharacterized protein n=1 Tax=Pseudomonas kitaguniensis TaxID=2607908 RepID=A0A5N7JPB2_9PSED|nr:hypothetical protein [Pseudomonas kitaguniensis]
MIRNASPEHAYAAGGSGLARDCAVSVEKYLSDTPQSRASPLPQKRFCSATPPQRICKIIGLLLAGSVPSRSLPTAFASTAPPWLPHVLRM